MKRQALLSTTLLLGLSAPALAVEKGDVVAHYADIATAKYEDSLTMAQRLLDAVNALVEAPSAEALEDAKAAWIAARVPYQQSEVYRFGNAIVDEWEGKVNAWPLDEGLIDYVDPMLGGNDENPYALANIVATPMLTISGATLDATTITPDVLFRLVSSVSWSSAAPASSTATSTTPHRPSAASGPMRSAAASSAPATGPCSPTAPSTSWADSTIS